MTRASNTYDIPAVVYASFNDTSFVTGDSPVTHNIHTVLSRNANDGFIDNYGSGDMQYSISEDGTNFGDNVYLPAGAQDDLRGYSMYHIKVTWVADTSYVIRTR